MQGQTPGGETFVVNTTGDEEDFNEFDGICDSDPSIEGGQCTFRAAIQNHNVNRIFEKNQIRFDIQNVPGSGSIVIKVGSTGLGDLPPILGAVDISGSNSDGRRIELDGTDAGQNAIGLELLGENCEVSSFVINNFSSHGMHFSGTQFSNGGHKITFMIIGTDESATIDKGNGGDGIFIEDVPNNTIGGNSKLEGNVIAGNTGYGIHILGRDPDITGFPLSGAPGNKLFNNFVGVDKIESTVLPNDSGGIFVNNAREVQVGEEPPAEPAPVAGAVIIQQQQPGKGNIITGVKEGIKVTGSLSKGVRLEANSIFAKDEAVAKLLVGIFARPGELFTATGNIITNVGDASLDLFFDANSRYVIKNNVLESILKAGAIIKFAENRVITVEYRNNSHLGLFGGGTSGSGLQIEESVRGTINWVLDSNFATNCNTGARIILRSSGEKNFTNNRWEFNVGMGIEYVNEFTQGAVARLTVKNEVSTGNAGEGFFLRTQLDATADVTVNMIKLIGSKNGKDGLSLALHAAAGAKAVINIGGETELSANASLAMRIVGEKSSIDVFKVDINKTSAKDNVEGAFYLFDVKLKFSVTENEIVGNGGPGIRLGGSTEARIDSNSISGNSIGIVTEDQAIASMSNNILTSNGKAIVVGAGSVGTALSANSIFANQDLGIDLGNDGVTFNDAGDADVGPNNLQNFPVLTSVSSVGENVIVEGSLNSIPNTSFRLEFFGNITCNSSGFGEGETFLGFSMVTTDANGNAFFTTQLSDVSLTPGTFVTATATDPTFNTSEFSACKQLGAAQASDLELAKQADKTTNTLGEQVLFTIKITNKGPEDATGIVVKDILPAGLDFISATSNLGSYNDDTGNWNIAILNSGSEAILTITATAIQVGTLINTAEITASDQPDPDSAPGNLEAGEDDQSSITITVTDDVTEPAQNIQQLISQIDNLVKDGLLSNKEAKKLVKSLEHALSQLNKGHPKVAIHQLQTFIKSVEHLMKKGQLTDAEGKKLIDAAETIIEQLPEKINKSGVSISNSALVTSKAEFRFYPIAPNPINVYANIRFEVNKESKVQLGIYDLNGRIVASLMNKIVSSGMHSVLWSTGNLPAGVYIVLLKVDEAALIQKVMVVK